jgi:hypothetical protein
MNAATSSPVVHRPPVGNEFAYMGGTSPAPSAPGSASWGSTSSVPGTGLP